jgi:hypothetical protein
VSAAHDQEASVLDYARALSSLGTDDVAIPGRGGRPARTATVELAAAPVWVPAPAGTPKRRQQPILAAWILRIWEAPPARRRRAVGVDLVVFAADGDTGPAL